MFSNLDIYSFLLGGATIFLMGSLFHCLSNIVREQKYDNYVFKVRFKGIDPCYYLATDKNVTIARTMALELKDMKDGNPYFTPKEASVIRNKLKEGLRKNNIDYFKKLGFKTNTPTTITVSRVSRCINKNVMVLRFDDKQISYDHHAETEGNF